MISSKCCMGTFPQNPYFLASGVGVWGPAINTTLTLHVSPATTKTNSTVQSKLLAPPQLPVFRAPDAGAEGGLGRGIHQNSQWGSHGDWTCTVNRSSIGVFFWGGFHRETIVHGAESYCHWYQSPIACHAFNSSSSKSAGIPSTLSSFLPLVPWCRFFPTMYPTVI